MLKTDVWLQTSNHSIFHSNLGTYIIRKPLPVKTLFYHLQAYFWTGLRCLGLSKHVVIIILSHFQNTLNVCVITFCIFSFECNIFSCTFRLKGVKYCVVFMKTIYSRNTSQYKNLTVCCLIWNISYNIC